MNPPVSRPFPWIVYWSVLIFIIVVALLPVLSVLASGWVANAHGCQLDEGSVHPCVINGTDRGELLYSMQVCGWFMLLTIPAGALAGLGWLVVLIFHRLTWRRRYADVSSGWAVGRQDGSA